MNTTLKLSCATLTLLALAACAGASEADADSESIDADQAHPEFDEMTHEQLVAAAEEDGEVVVYSFTSRIATVAEEFRAQYPGIDIVEHDVSSTELIERLRSEHQAGADTADVAYVSDAPVVWNELLQQEVLLRYIPERVEDLLDEQYKEPLLTNRLSTKVLMYNEEAHPDGAPVDYLWELTEPQWQSQVVMVDPTGRGDYLDLMTEIVLRADEMETTYQEYFGEPIELDEGVENAGYQFIADLYANDAILVSSTDDVNEAVGAVGQQDPPIGFATYSDRRDNEDEGWALQVANDVAPGPGIIFPAMLGITAEAQNPAAARLLIDFMMGDDSSDGGPAYAPFYVPGDYPTRSDLATPEEALPLEEFNAWLLAPEESAAVRGEVNDFILTVE
ncbi:ABC transporter substrate-binding protein [Nesterenkonia muleiensis]|uniref:ABC transporter substrate-binding protein n=1 Tax=Nesterenkonia muleiensis TaxID=2282648 RepID=UPI000E73B4CC|nr:extracellular solute-binding protein [Nesterenkonia muleiensis]